MNLCAMCTPFAQFADTLGKCVSKLLLQTALELFENMLQSGAICLCSASSLSALLGKELHTETHMNLLILLRT